MAVVIRLAKHGSTHNPFYRVVVADKKRQRNGRFIEKLGTYDPKQKDADKQINVDVEKAKEWISKGAQPSDTVRSVLKRAGL